MFQVATNFVNIDAGLHFVFFGLQIAIDRPLSISEIDRVFSDERNDSVSVKNYVFYKSILVSLTGTVDEYEPETIWLTLRHRNAKKILKDIVESANLASSRLERMNEECCDS